jgi:hypothetical protein
MPITYSERPITERERELLEIDIQAWQQNLVRASRRFLNAFLLFLGSAVTIAIAVMLFRTDTIVFMVLGGLLCFCLLIFVFLVVPNFGYGQGSRDALQQAITTSQQLLEKGMVQVVRIETERVVLYDTGDEDVGEGYFIQIGPQETLYLSCSHWNWDYTEEMLISNDDIAPAIHTSFELVVEEVLSAYHPTGEVLVPCATLTCEDFYQEELPPSHRSFRLSNESDVTYFYHEDRAIYKISLTDLLDNPAKIHDVTQDFL